jgi:hypothetical protein
MGPKNSALSRIGKGGIPRGMYKGHVGMLCTISRKPTESSGLSTHYLSSTSWHNVNNNNKSRFTLSFVSMERSMGITSWMARVGMDGYAGFDGHVFLLCENYT